MFLKFAYDIKFKKITPFVPVTFSVKALIFPKNVSFIYL